MKFVYLSLFLLGASLGPVLDGAPTHPKTRTTAVAPVQSMQSVEVDILGTDVLKPALGQIQTENADLTWPEDRYLIGWSPWIGYGKGSVLESHFILIHNGTQLFLRGPHKENPVTMYDCAATAEFFPAGTGRLVHAGEKVSVQFLVLDTGSQPGQIGGQANARIFSVKVTP